MPVRAWISARNAAGVTACQTAYVTIRVVLADDQALVRAGFRAILESRLAKIPQPAKRTRVEKVLKKLA